jgi:hypothetical protein
VTQTVALAPFRAETGSANGTTTAVAIERPVMALLSPRWSLFALGLLHGSACTANDPSPEAVPSETPPTGSDSAPPVTPTAPTTGSTSKATTSTESSQGTATQPNGDSSTAAMPPEDSSSSNDAPSPPVTPTTSEPPGDSSAASTSDAAPSDGVPDEGIAIVGRAIYVDGKLFHIKGVNWNPVAQGNVHPDNLDYAGFADRDIPLMKAAGINAVRTYERLDNREVLDKLQEAGIYVFSTVLGWWQDDASVVTERVNAVKDHPAILAWVLGNEWNYNGLYSRGNGGDLTDEQVRDKLNDAAALIKAADPNHPVASIYGEIATIAPRIADMPEIDIWGINAYRSNDHAALITEWAGLSTKPMFMGEYGADAWDSRGEGQENLAAQAEATAALTQQIVDAYTTTSGGITSGGFVFEWADEWWKAGNPDVHDSSHEDSPGGGPYPDGEFNEEWWGIVDIDRNPRPAYEALKAIYLGQ